MRVYVASSWRNPRQPSTVQALRAAGHEVYDFKNPRPAEHGFSWAEIDPWWEDWSAEKFRAALDHPVAKAGFDFDWEAMEWADVGVLDLPCGRSAHLEAGYFVGAGKPLVILLNGPGEPELMYRMSTSVVLDHEELVLSMKTLERAIEDAAKILSLPTCRVCGCTDLDCRQCIEKTGEPCYWVEEDLCSACVAPT